MATQVQPRPISRLVPPSAGLPVGVWWPQSRRLGDSLAELFALWPPEGGRISRVLYSPPDWDDHPHSVPLPDRRVKTGCFPHDDTHALVLTMSDGRPLRLALIAPDTPATSAHRMLVEASELTSAVVDAFPTWENEGGHS